MSADQQHDNWEVPDSHLRLEGVPIRAAQLDYQAADLQRGPSVLIRVLHHVGPGVQQCKKQFEIW